jgi:hypothetical protein
MSSQIATYEDANLHLRLYELRREDKLREAREWFGTRVRDITPKVREVFKNPLYLHNMKEACSRFEKHPNKVVPGAYGEMAAVVRA